MHTVIHFDTQLLNLLGGVIIPLLVAMLTKITASSKLKSATMVVLALASSFITVALGEPEDGIPLYDLLFSFGQIILASGVSYNNILKPLGLIGSVQKSTANFGLGTVDSELTNSSMHAS